MASSNESGIDRNVGHGVLFPLRFVGDDYDSAGGSPLFSSRLRKVLGVHSADPDGAFSGEYPWRGELGSQVGRLRHANVDDLFDEIAQVFAVDAVAEWEPLALAGLSEVTVRDQGDGQASTLKLRFTRFRDQTGAAVELEDVETEV